MYSPGTMGNNHPPGVRPWGAAHTTAHSVSHSDTHATHATLNSAHPYITIHIDLARGG